MMKHDDYIKEQKKSEEVISKLTTNTQIACILDKIRELIASGKIPKEPGGWFLKNLEEQEEQYQKWVKFINDNPDLSEKECTKRFYNISRKLSFEESLMYDDTIKKAQMFEILVKNLSKAQEENEHLLKVIEAKKAEPKQLYNLVDLKNNFGVAAAMANIFYRLITKTLENDLEPSLGKDKAFWEIKVVEQGRHGNKVSLIHEFPAKDYAEAKKYTKSFKRTIRTIGLRVFLAFWREANEHNRVEFTCNFKDVLSQLSKEGRISRYDQRELKRFWKVTRMLQRTKIRFEGKKRGKLTPWRDQPLIYILGGAQADDEKYPRTLRVRLLEDWQMDDDFAPHIYRNSILKKDDNTILLAFAIQQRGQTLENLNWDWHFLLTLGNVSGTAIKNKRGARAKIRKKFKDFKKDNEVDSFTESKTGMAIKTKPPLEKLPKEKPKKAQKAKRPKKKARSQWI